MEREAFTDNIRESLKINESVISRIQPSDDPHRKHIEERTLNPRQLHRNAKVLGCVIYVCLQFLGNFA